MTTAYFPADHAAVRDDAPAYGRASGALSPERIFAWVALIAVTAFQAWFTVSSGLGILSAVG
jgi:hypothetical protein